MVRELVKVTSLNYHRPPSSRVIHRWVYLGDMADYSLVGGIDPDIKTLLDNYFDVMHFQDMDLFDQVFHKDCCLYGVPDGVLSLRPYEVYRQAVANRESPASKGEKRDDRILMFDQLSPTLALVKPQLEMFGGVMQDYLNIVKIDGKWWIKAKMWQQVGLVA